MLLRQKAKSEKEKYNTLTSSKSDDNTMSDTKKQIITSIKETEDKIKEFKAELNKIESEASESKKDVDIVVDKQNTLSEQNKQKNLEIKNVQAELTNHRNIINVASENLVKYQSEIATAKSKVEDLETKIKKSKDNIEESKKTRQDKNR